MNCLCQWLTRMQAKLEIILLDHDLFALAASNIDLFICIKLCLGKAHISPRIPNKQTTSKQNLSSKNSIIQIFSHYLLSLNTKINIKQYFTETGTTWQLFWINTNIPFSNNTEIKLIKAGCKWFIILHNHSRRGVQSWNLSIAEHRTWFKKCDSTIFIFKLNITSI